MVDRRLQPRGEHDPEAEARDRPDDCGDRPDDEAVGEQDQAEVLLRGADGGEHAELTEPALSDDCEACGGDQRGEEEEDGGHGDHRQRVHPFRRVVAPHHLSHECRYGCPEGAEQLEVGVDQNGDVLRRRGRGGDKSELVGQLARVLDDAHDRPPHSVECQGRPELEP